MDESSLATHEVALKPSSSERKGMWPKHIKIGVVAHRDISIRIEDSLGRFIERSLFLSIELLSLIPLVQPSSRSCTIDATKIANSIIKEIRGDNLAPDIRRTSYYPFKFRHVSIYLHHQQGRGKARIGRVAGSKDLYLGTFATEEEATEAYDIAAIKFRGVNAVTNFEMNRYDVEAIMKSALPIGGAAKRLKLSRESEQKQSLLCSSLQTQ